MGKILKIIADELIVLFIAAMPLAELRGAIPVGVAMGMNPVHATILGIIGSLIPVPFLLVFLEPIFMHLKRTKLLKGLIDKMVKKTIKKGKHIDRYRVLGLIIFVAIPLPGTGVWTGSLAAILFNIPRKYALPAIAIGSFIAGIIIFTLSYMVIAI